MNRISVCIIALAALTFPARTIADPPLNVTVYNGGTALVHDRRVVQLKRGLNHIAWRGVSARIDATSVVLTAPGAPDGITVLQQNVNDNLLSPSAVLQSYVGRDVTVVHDPQFPGDRSTSETARILSANDGIVLQYRHGVETQVRGHIVYPSVSGRFNDRPTLELDVESKAGGPQRLDLGYLTSGLSWNVEYAGVLTTDEKHLSLIGLVTVSNTSGMDYNGVHLQLVAGDVRIVQPPAPPPPAAQKNMVFAPSVAADTFSVPGVVTRNEFEYYLYSIDRPVTIRNNQTEQLSLLSARDIPVTKTLELAGAESYESAQPDLGDRLPVSASISFEDRGGDLGIPLPAGIIRVYKDDAQGLSQFVGSDDVGHTPKNARVRVNLGDSFDVTATKRQTDFSFLSNSKLPDSRDCASESSYEITFANAKDVTQDVRAVETFPGSWQITAENIRHTKSSASTATWTVRVPAGGQATLTYTAQVTWC